MNHPIPGAAHVVAAAMMVFVAGCPLPTVDDGDGVIATGTTPNSVATVRCGGVRHLLVASSGEGNLERVDPEGQTATSTVFLGVGSTPWDVGVLNDDDAATGGPRAVVSLPGRHSLALVDPCADVPVVLDEVSSTADVTVDPPVTLREPEDVNGDGEADVVVTRMIPRTPQAIVGAGRSVFVVWANLLAFSTSSTEPMLSGPGLLTRFTLDDDGEHMTETGHALLPCENPGGLAVTHDDSGAAGAVDDVIVTCAGRFVVGVDGFSAASPGGLVRVHAGPGTAFVVEDAIVLDDHTPGPVVSAHGELVTGDLLDGTVRAFDPLTFAEQRRTAPTSGVDSVFALTVMGDDVVVAGWFSGRVQREPLDDGPSRQLTDGPSRGLVDLVCDEVGGYGLLSLSAELMPFSFDGDTP
jgi:hypothetical protein